MIGWSMALPSRVLSARGSVLLSRGSALKFETVWPEGVVELETLFFKDGVPLRWCVQRFRPFPERGGIARTVSECIAVFEGDG